jgi:Rap1a immunity proteins
VPARRVGRPTSLRADSGTKSRFGCPTFPVPAGPAAAKFKDETRLVGSLDRKSRSGKIPGALGFETAQAADEKWAHPVDWTGCDRRVCIERGRSRKRARARRLLSKPRARRTREALTCWGYMQAMQDLSVLADENEHRIMGACPPEQTTTLQLIRSFVRYARAHRRELPGNAVVAVFRALREAYPCRAEHGE